MLNSEHLSLVNKIGDKTEFTITRVHYKLQTSIKYELGNAQKVLQTIQMKLILLCVWAEPAVLGSAKTALKFIYKI